MQATVGGDVEQLAGLVGSLSGFARGFDPDALLAGDAVTLLSVAARGEAILATIKALAALRVDKTRAWKHAGFRSAADYAAAKTGTTASAAKEASDTARKARDLPNTDVAMRNGDLTARQAREVADAATADPGAEKGLLDSAEHDDYSSFQKKARKAKAAADPDPAARARRIYKERSLRHWTDPEGAFNAVLRTTPEAGARFLAGLEPHRRAVFDQARRDGRREAPEAYLADALDHLATAGVIWPAGTAHDAADPATGASRATSTSQAPRTTLFDEPLDNERPPAPPPSPTSRSDSSHHTAQPSRPSGAPPPPRSGLAPPPTTVHLFVDLTALQRGHLQPGDTCEIPGIGPINLTTARSMLGDATVKLIIKHGNDIATVIHHGRTVTARQRSALETRDPCCIVPGCGVTHHLEIDHRTGWAINHQTQLTDLARLCKHHHHLKTHEGYTYTGSPDHWTWHPPHEAPHHGTDEQDVA